jgi:glycosyltransferase involved in cell wall biosynthesis
MKIAAIEYHPTSTKGGSEKAYFEVLVGLKNLGHDVIVFYTRSGDYLSIYHSLGIRTQSIPEVVINYTSISSWVNLMKAAKIINKSNPEIIYINQLADSVLSTACKLLKKVNIVCHIRVPKIGNSRLFNIIGKFVDRFICVNHLIVEQYQLFFPKKKLTVVNDGIKISEIKSLHKAKAKSKTATFLGRISPEKGLLELIDTWSILTKNYNLSVKLDINGPVPPDDAYYKKLINKIEDNELSELIRVNGPVSNPSEHFMNYDFSVFPSIIDESFGRTIPESILAGTPVFARNVGIVKEILEPATNLLVYEKDEELAEKIFNFYKVDLEIDIDKLQNHIIEYYDIDKNVLIIDAVLRQSVPHCFDN